jgi:adenylylsulfate reductase subunit B
MSIESIPEDCVGCGLCVAVCPGSLIRLDSAGKAFLNDPQNCWGCASCIKECPHQALKLYLGSDIGGLGGRLSVQREGHLLHWTVEKPDGATQTVIVDRQNANKY